jgi:hypothetical protein
MTSAPIRHRALLDHETLVERTYTVSVIVDAMRADPAWRDSGDILRRRVAKRFAFAMWATQNGTINEANYE